MTSLLDRPTRPTPPPSAPSRRPALAGAVNALWAAVASLLLLGLPVLLVWAADARSGAGATEALRTAGALWLAASGATLDLQAGRWGLTPLGLALVPLALLARAGRTAARDSAAATVRAALALVAGAAGAYAAVATGVALATATDQVAAGPLRVLATTAGVGAVGAGLGVLRARPGALARRLGERAARLLPATATAVGTLLAGGALLVGTALALRAGRVTELAQASDPGAVGGVALLAVNLSLVPNAVVWGAAWLAGPGFAVGAGTVVGPFAHELGAVPGLPLLAGLPGSAVPLWVGALAMVVPLAGGVLAGRLVARGLTGAGAWRTAAEAVLVGPCAGAVLLVLAWLAGGPAGSGRLVDVGPSPWAVGIAVTGHVAVGALAASLALRAREARRAQDPAG